MQDILDKLAKELEDRNMDVIYKMREKHVHGKTTAAKEHQRLLLKVKDLHTSLQAWNVKARDSLFSSNVRIADERPPAYTGGSAKCRDVIIQEALNSLDNIQTQKGDVGMSGWNKTNFLWNSKQKLRVEPLRSGCQKPLSYLPRGFTMKALHKIDCSAKKNSSCP
ncbi:hypothetical protein HPB52_017311 [Rhipicephalus sanguineus]|uniref:Uncharacterized protein n=1 Tax=Rhipicephalus sanguineus TaxID=34632 RepID=A0A9D4SP64_RHISA|nr:hypothetical protein HPB52_017311 [Rhipicephalus sanguineus]